MGYIVQGVWAGYAQGAGVSTQPPKNMGGSGYYSTDASKIVLVLGSP